MGSGAATNAVKRDILPENVQRLALSEKIDFNNISSTNKNSEKMKSSKSDFFVKSIHSKESKIFREIKSEKIDVNNISSANENSAKMKSSKSDFFREINLWK